MPSLVLASYNETGAHGDDLVITKPRTEFQLAELPVSNFWSSLRSVRINGQACDLKNKTRKMHRKQQQKQQKKSNTKQNEAKKRNKKRNKQNIKGNKNKITKPTKKHTHNKQINKQTNE